METKQTCSRAKIIEECKEISNKMRFGNWLPFISERVASGGFLGVAILKKAELKPVEQEQDPRYKAGWCCGGTMDRVDQTIADEIFGKKDQA